MKQSYILFAMTLGLNLFSGCSKDNCSINHGCTDTQANNYNSEATIDNNSCCYNCYSEHTNFGEFCGSEVDDMSNSYDEIPLHAWILDGEFVFPDTPGGIPAFDSNGNPVYLLFPFEITCD